MLLFLCGLEERVSQMLSQCWSHTEVGGFLYVGVYLLLLRFLVAVAELRLWRSSSLTACVQMLVFLLCQNHWWGWRRWGTWSSWFFASWMNHTVSDLTFIPGRIWPWIRLPLSSWRVSSWLLQKSQTWGCQAWCSSHCVTAPLALKWWKLRVAQLLKGKILLVTSWAIAGSGNVQWFHLCYSWINHTVIFFCCSISLWLGLQITGQWCCSVKIIKGIFGDITVLTDEWIDWFHFSVMVTGGFPYHNCMFDRMCKDLNKETNGFVKSCCKVRLWQEYILWTWNDVFRPLSTANKKQT